MVAADVQFRLAANAAAEQYRRPPPYLAYHTTATVNVPAFNKHKMIERAVETRTSDDFAVLQDLPRGQRQYGQSFPLIPTFDALSYFRLEYSGAQHRDVLAHVTTYAPITFAAPNATTPGVTVVSTTLRNYYARYADDSNDTLAHIFMDPLKALTQNNNSDFYLHELYINRATNLPSRVTYTGHDNVVFTIDYTTVDDHWLVSHVYYTRTFFAPFHIGQTSFSVDATFDTFTFPLVPPTRSCLHRRRPRPTRPLQTPPHQTPSRRTRRRRCPRRHRRSDRARTTACSGKRPNPARLRMTADGRKGGRVADCT